MVVPSLASATALRLKRQLPVYRESARRLVAEAGAALADAKKADAKSCLSFYGRLFELSKSAATLRTPTESVFDDTEAIVKHRKDLPEADGRSYTEDQEVTYQEVPAVTFGNDDEDALEAQHEG